MWRAGLLASALCASAATADVAAARYVQPTDIYGHGAVPGGEYAAVNFDLSDGRSFVFSLSGAVFEDTVPRLVDLDGDGTPEVVTVVSYFDQGAAIRIWDEVAAPDQPGGTIMAMVAETAPIGTRFRWLAVAGAADLDSDGLTEIAYVDRPHLAKTLRVIEVQNTGAAWVLRPEAAAPGYTNHKYNDPVIEGGISDCAVPEIITASGDWRRVLATRLQDGALISRDLGPYTGPASLTTALTCR